MRRSCGGCCAFCSSPCSKGEVRGKQEEFPLFSPAEEQGASEAFDSAKTQDSVVILQEEDIQPETGLVIREPIDTYEVKKSIFGKEVVRKVTNGTK